MFVALPPHQKPLETHPSSQRRRARAVLLLGFFLLRGLGSWLVVQDPLEKADGILILGGTMYERQLEAVELFKEGWAPRLFLLREIADWGEVELIKRGFKYLSVVDAQIDAMERLGVPRDRITVLDPANSTAQEADILFSLRSARNSPESSSSLRGSTRDARVWS